MLSHRLRSLYRLFRTSTISSLLLTRRGCGSTKLGKASLEAAIHCNDIELWTWLLDSDMGVGITPVDLTKALGTIVKMGHLPIVQLLVARGADINARLAAAMHQSVLQYAVSFSHRHIVEFLLRSGADVNAPEDADGRMAVAIAINRHQNEIVRLLLVSGADMNEHGPSAVIEAVSVGSPELLRLVMDAWKAIGDIDTRRIVSRCRETLPSLAVRCAKYELTRILFGHNMCKAEDTSSALLRAVEHGNSEVVRLLLALGAYAGYEQDEFCWDLDTEGWYYRVATALDKAAKSGNVDILGLLLRPPTTVEERTRALQVAAVHNKLNAVISLLDQGANVNAAPPRSEEYESRTALQAAAATGNLKLVRCLLDAGAAVESMVPSARETYTALQLAAIAGSLNVVIALIQEGADVRAPAIGGRGCTALEGAAGERRVDTVKFLIVMGAEVTGSRAVRCAERSDYDGVVALLLSNRFEDDFDKSRQDG
jgi:ankyrin repeat protein